ncbi:MAG: sigma-70 family RNA polymerase sigma factor [Lentisphaerae bacterium]|nr:sigma-70 family RNA polymerase sigma factor [Lentisphaerota bacterium]
MIPETSTTLLKGIANGENARWTEFVARYRPMMQAYMKSHFPAVDADDTVQETLIALSNVIHGYRYAPDETGRFRNYLTGILRRKALKQCEKATKERTAKAELKELAEAGEAFGTPDDSDSWKDAVLEIAMRQILDDDKIPEKSKQIFQRLTVDGVSPDEVAAEYGTNRNNVDKTKSRMLARLREIVRTLEEAGDA